MAVCQELVLLCPREFPCGLLGQAQEGYGSLPGPARCSLLSSRPFFDLAFLSSPSSPLLVVLLQAAQVCLSHCRLRRLSPQSTAVMVTVTVTLCLGPQSELTTS